MSRRLDGASSLKRIESVFELGCDGMTWHGMGCSEMRGELIEGALTIYRHDFWNLCLRMTGYHFDTVVAMSLPRHGLMCIRYLSSLPAPSPCFSSLLYSSIHILSLSMMVL